METHRFVRKHLAEDSAVDRYDLNLRSPTRRFAPTPATEYWTNGKTTLLSVSASKPVQNPVLAPNLRRQSRMTSSSDSSSSTSQNVVRNSLLAGSVAGTMSTLVCHPFDVLRVKMQSAALATASPSASSHLSLIGIFRHTLQSGGIRAFYTGLALPLAAQSLYKGTIFTMNNVTEQAIREWKTQENYKLGNFIPYKVTMTDRFFCGFMGGAVNGAIFVTPVEYIRNQLIAHTNSTGSSPIASSRLKGPVSVMRKTLQREGVSGLWRGMASTIMRDSIGCGCFFVAMSYSQEQMMAENQQEEGSPPSHSVLIASGAIAGVAFWLVALPIDTLKTWIQSGNARNLSHALELSQKDGMRQSLVSLNRGWQVAYGRGAPSAAITVTTYSSVYNFLNQTTG